MKGGIPSEIAQNLKIDWGVYGYEPIVYLSDFWMLNKNLMMLNDTLDGT